MTNVPEPRSAELRAVERELLHLAWPAAAQGLLYTCVFVVDGLMVSWLGSSSLAAVGAAAPVIWSTTSVLFALFAATVALVANRTGGGDADGARAAAGQSLALALALGLVFGLPLVFLRHRLLGVFGLEPEVARMAAQYLAIVGGGLVLTLPARVLVWTFQASGDTRTPLVVGAAGNLVNVVGNYVFMYGKLGAPAMGVAGAAVGTVLCRAVELLLLGVRCRRLPACPTLRDIALPRFDVLGQIFRIGLPAVGEQVVLHAGIQSFVVIMSHLGTAALAAHRIAVSIEMVAILPAEGLSIATAALTGQRLGAGEPDLAAHVIRTGRIRALQLQAPLAVVFLLFPGAMVSFFQPDPEVLRGAIQAVRVGAFELVPLGVAMTLCGALKGAGDTRSPLTVTAVGVWCLRVPLTIAFGHVLGLGIAGVWMATTLDWTCRTLLAERAVRRGQWRTALSGRAPGVDVSAPEIEAAG